MLSALKACMWVGQIKKAKSTQPYPASRDVYRMAVNDCSFSDKLIRRINVKDYSNDLVVKYNQHARCQEK